MRTEKIGNHRKGTEFSGEVAGAAVVSGDKEQTCFAGSAVLHKTGVRAIIKSLAHRQKIVKLGFSGSISYVTLCSTNWTYISPATLISLKVQRVERQRRNGT
jgi:hypothetical protein